MALPPPPYQGQQDVPFIEPVHSKNLKIDPVALTAWGDKLEKAALDLVPIKARLDALTYALADDWCAPRVLENELYHLSDSIGLGIEDFDDSRGAYFVSKYLTETLATLQEGEADLATWQQMTEAQREERWAEREREQAEAEERRKKKAEISAKQNAFYSALSAMGLSPIPMSEMSEPGFRLPEASRKIHELELEISNLGNDLYE